MPDVVRDRTRFEANILRTEGCWLYQGFITETGYGRLKFDGAYQYAHRVSYQMYCGPIADGSCICHHCDNPCCVNPKHLFLGSRGDNVRDMDEKGRRLSAYGEQSGVARWHNGEIEEMRRLYHEGVDLRLLGLMFRTAESAISTIVRGKTWRHIPIKPFAGPRKRRRFADMRRMSRLTDEQVVHIRQEGRLGRPYIELAAKFDCHVNAVIDAAIGETFARVSEPVVGRRGKRQGEEVWRAILTEKDVRAIRQGHPDIKAKELAARYKVSSSTIYLIIHRKTWRHVV